MKRVDPHRWPTVRDCGQAVHCPPPVVLLTLLALAGLAALSGCLRGHGSGAGTHDEEAEHHVPAHRPADLSAAVQRLRELHRELETGDPVRPAAELDAGAEYRDIVVWLPELAADSDLPRAPWERIQQFSRDLVQLLEPVWRAESTTRQAAYRRQAAAVSELLHQLEELVP